MKNQLYYGDNLAVLRDYIKDDQDRAFPRIQILTIEEILAGKEIELPRLLEVTYKQAPKAKARKAENLELDLG
jgi:hypothetical protein